jgi:ATP-dependent protease HslVU (ClpYQ) ATPase subunit
VAIEILLKTSKVSKKYAKCKIYPFIFYDQNLVQGILLPLIGVSWLAMKIGPVSTMALMLFIAYGLIGFIRVRKKFKK